MSDLECPYCKNEFEYTGDPMGDGDSSEEECGECEKKFFVQASVSVSYFCREAECLNDESKHEYQITCTYPREFTKMECHLCERTRSLSEEERIKFNIPLKERVTL